MPKPTVPAEVLNFAQQLSNPKPMRRGSVTERYVKCNKAGCLCGDSEDDRHGPYYSVSRVVKGRTTSRWLDARQADTVRRQVADGQQFRKNIEMRYPEFRAQGLSVGSGVVEAGCKTAIGVRCKRAGMHWTVSGADAIIALRCCKLSGRFEDFWERRSAAVGQ